MGDVAKTETNARFLVPIGLAIALVGGIARGGMFVSTGGGIAQLLDPAIAIVLAWALAPVACVAFLLTLSKSWLAPLILLSTFGNAFVFGFAHPLDWLIYPISEWVFIVASALVIGLVKWLDNDG